MPSRIRTVTLLIAVTLISSARAQDDKLAKLKEKPITMAQGKVGELLRQWWKEGTAAGNVGEVYDNRDRDHSALDLGPYPQLQKYVYAEADLKVKRDWAAQQTIVPGIVFGNSSTSVPPTQGGSNVRSYYLAPRGLAFLYKQYTSNNVYIYPEHRDHDPGHNGRGDGYGDLYPTNTPYLFTSQGSSGSDQPFMRAIPFTLAAFRPEVKKKLADAGLLMPTLQMIFRATYSDPATRGKPAGAKEYLSARKHPTVFEGSWVNELGMVQMAHDMQADHVPPMIQMKVLDESKAQPGRDFFDLAGGEDLGTTPAVIARVVRGKDYQRKMVVSLAGSYDLNKKPLTFTWVLLRGDPARVNIVPRNQEQSEAEITVGYHERRPIAAGSAMESNRVDVGVFAHNGTYYSAPGFVTLYSLDNEARTYDQTGRVVEIGYAMGEVRFNVTNWTGVLELLGNDSPAARLLNLSEEQRASCKKVQELHQKLTALKEKDTPQRLDELLDGRAKDMPFAVRPLVDKKLHELSRDLAMGDRAGLADMLQKAEPARLAGVQAERKRLVNFGLAVDDNKGLKPNLKFVDPGSPSKYELAQVQRYHASVLANVVLPGCLNVAHQLNFVDQRLTAPRDWRDLYHYDGQDCLGWTRYTAKGPMHFTADGMVVLKKDALGRPAEARTVFYTREPGKPMGLNANPLKMVLGATIVTFTYDGPNDRRGKVKDKRAAAD